MQKQLPFKCVKKRAVPPVKAPSNPVYECFDKLQKHVVELQNEVNRLRWYEFQYKTLTESKTLKNYRLSHLLHQYIEDQTQKGEYTGIFY